MNSIETAAGMAATPGYRYADRVGDQLHVAGQVPLDATGSLVGDGDVAAQACACLDNLRTLVQAHGFSLDDVHRLTVHVVGDRQHLAEAWVAVREWFEGEVPPATLLGAHVLGYVGQLVEVDATVVRA